jgi:uncharacterized membrane protein
MFAPKIRTSGRPVPALARAATYGVLGCLMELVFTAVTSFVRRGQSRPSTSPLMLPVYALACPLFEPVHDRLRGRVSLPARAAIYGAGFQLVEFVSGSVLRRITGEAPWDYRHARLNIDGLVRLDYLPLWAVVGLGAEQVHDRLMRRRPVPAR